MSSRKFTTAFAAIVLPIAASAVTIQSAERLGNVTSSNTENIRDLGFSGTIGNVSINSYGDTLICGDGSAKDRYYQTQPCVLLDANSAAYATDDPQVITDFNLSADGNAQMFCDYFPDESPASSYGMGITNVVAEPGSDTQGILYFLKNYRPTGVDQIVGAGVAVVDVSGEYPSCTRTSEYVRNISMSDRKLSHCSHWWDATKEPYYGDHSSVMGQDGYVYVYGGVNTTMFYGGLYLTRVPHASQTDLSAYEYWNGTQYTPDRIYSPSETEAVLQGGSTQGMITWNPYLNSYLYIYTGRFIFLY
jgi:hypothetical protein